MENLTIETKPLELAVEASEDSPTKIGHKAGSSPDSLSRLLNRDARLNLSTITKIAGYLGFNTRVAFEPTKKKEKKQKCTT